MAFPATLRAALEELLGGPLIRASEVYGGDINRAAQVETADGRCFVKWSDSAPPNMFSTEAEGLRRLAAADALRVPGVIAQGKADGGPDFLVLEWIEAGSKYGSNDGVMESFGAGLAALHQRRAEQHGLDHDNFIGRLPQPNQQAADWAGFYLDQRIGCQTKFARQRGRLNARREDLLTRLLERLPDLLAGVDAPPALLHGDLWGGNYLVDDQGRAVLIDPAVYYGHREMDLAMTELFGGFAARFYDAYHAAYPIDPGYRERRELYQLYYILVHLNLFGESYGGRVDSIAARYVRR